MMKSRVARRTSHVTRWTIVGLRWISTRDARRRESRRQTKLVRCSNPGSPPSQLSAPASQLPTLDETARRCSAARSRSSRAPQSRSSNVRQIDIYIYIYMQTRAIRAFLSGASRAGRRTYSLLGGSAHAFARSLTCLLTCLLTHLLALLGWSAPDRGTETHVVPLSFRARLARACGSARRG